MDTNNIQSDSVREVLPGIEPALGSVSGFWRRLLAFVLDGFCLGLAGFVLGLFLFDPLAHLGGWGRLLGFCIALVYFGVLNSVIGDGQTIGKRLMKIEVVDRYGNHISLGRSLLRYAVFGIPFFLNGALIPPEIMMSPMGYIIGFILFGMGGAIIYLFIFNRHTRQSLHDLVVGSFVTTTMTKGRVVDSIWRPHLIMVGIWFLAVMGLLWVMTDFDGKGGFPELQAIQSEIQSTGKVFGVTATVGKSWSIGSGDHAETTYFQANAIWRERPHDYDAAAQQVAFLVLRKYPDIMDKDVLAVSIIYGYDIGIARSWISHCVRHSPKEWKEMLGGTSREI